VRAPPQLVEAGVPRLHGTAALEQEQAQVLASTIPAGKAQALAREQPARGQGRVDEVVLPPPSVLAPRALALVDDDLGSLEVANEASAITPGALDGEGRYAELLRPAEQEP
jgi:hypothetical protein